jgi:hypothetical protein
MTQAQGSKVEPNSKATIASMAVIAIAISSALHEGVGHGLTAWLRGDIPTELTSNHLSDLRPDRLVDAGGTLVNLAAGAIAMFAARLAGNRAHIRYFLWLVGCFNLMDGAGYFLFSGILGLGDWQGVIEGVPHYIAWRVGMTIFGAGLYFVTVKVIAHQLRPFCPNRIEYRSLYNTVGRLPYYSACAFYSLAGAFDPLGFRLLLLSTIPAAIGGNSGLMWADSLLPKASPGTGPPLRISRRPGWWIASIVLGLIYLLVLGRGVHFVH